MLLIDDEVITGRTLAAASLAPGWPFVSIRFLRIQSVSRGCTLWNSLRAQAFREEG